jgi:hypothetical protein
MSEENGKQSKLDYDFEFITQSLGLLPYQALNLDDQTTFHGAMNIAAIINLEVVGDGTIAITLHGGEEIILSDSHMAELEAAIKQRAETATIIQEEAVRNRAKMEMRVMTELQASVQPGMIVGAAPGGKRFRQ